MSLRRISIFLLFLVLAYSRPSLAQDHPAADPKAVVQRGFARFTVLTPQTIRLEYDSTGKFNDAASFMVINRKLPVPNYQVSENKGWLTLITQYLTLTYQLGSGPFNASNLGIVYRKPGSSATINWKPGDQQKENLGGTYKTLDGVKGDSSLYYKKRLQLEAGLLAKDGWTLLNDSKDLLFDDSPWPWVKARPDTKATDWYFMGYGHYYKSALLDFTKIAGKIPLPPRYAFGYWWSRYWSYSDNELRDLVQKFHEFHVPLDVLVIDMDWHNEYSKDQWTGWSFNKAYFPGSEPFLSWLHQNKVKVTLNLHPAFGIAPGEPVYPAVAKSTGFDTTSHAVIPYKGSDKTFMSSLFKDVLRPLQKQGVDFWWLDWQQTPNDKAIPQLSNVWWLNYAFFTNMERNGTNRPLIYHRWGGLGNHRYQIGFSGDTFISWASLAYQPVFTNAASNVLYGYWSHDIGGHMSLPGESGIDPEMYTRWMQYGALSPIFRTHSSKGPTLNKELWNFRGEYFDAISSAIKLRYALDPYIYTMARKAYDTGVSLCRPLYYQYDLPEAYTNKTEYMFGDDVLVAPIGEPMNDGSSKIDVWLPPGDWYEWHTGTLLKGGQKLNRSFAITEYPVYAKAGAIIPLYPDTVSNLQKQPGKQIFALFPGGRHSSATLYEDNGDDHAYDKKYATTRITAEKTTVTIWPRSGNYPGMPATKDYELQLIGVLPPKQVLVNGKSVRIKYDGATLTAVVDIPKTNCKNKIVVSFAAETMANGLVAKMKRVRDAVKALKYRNADLVVSAEIGGMEELNRELEYLPVQAAKLIAQFNLDYEHLPELVKGLKLSAEDEKWFLKAIEN